jgi:hypothetical protein
MCIVVWSPKEQTVHGTWEIEHEAMHTLIMSNDPIMHPIPMIKKRLRQIGLVIPTTIPD